MNGEAIDRESREHKGYGFCGYKDEETTLSARRNLQRHEINGRKLSFVDNSEGTDQNKQQGLATQNYPLTRQLLQDNSQLSKALFQVLLTPTHLAIVMEYAAGGELFERICSAERFSEDEVILKHDEICHRDLKLANTLLDGSPNPRLKMCDFGYSKIFEMSFWKYGPTARKALQELVTSLAAVPDKFLDGCLHMLVSNFLPPRKLREDPCWYSLSPHLERFLGRIPCDFMKYFREDLHRRLLSTDFKKQVDGLEMLQKALPSNGKEMIELLDVLLRWFVLRFCVSNTTCLLKVLEFLPELVDVLKDVGYTLTEAEASIFLPCLIEKGQLVLLYSLEQYFLRDASQLLLE